MEFIANYWWLWLVVLLATGGAAIYFWIVSLLSIGQDALAITKRVVNTANKSYAHISNAEKTTSQKAQGVAGEVAAQAAEVAIERATDKAKKFGKTAVLTMLAVVSGVLLVLSIVFNML